MNGLFKYFKRLWVMPNDFEMMCSKVLSVCDNLKLNGLKLSFEMNGIDER